MTATLRFVLGQMWPRRVRTRLTVFYAVLFMVLGIVLVAVIYGLSAKLLVPAAAPSPNRLTPQEVALLGRCKPLPTEQALLSQCKHLFAALGVGLQARGDALAKLRIASVVGLGLVVAGAVALGWLVAGRALRPVRAMTQAARRASELSLGERLAMGGPDDELKELADTFDLMLERLDAAFTSQRRFVANAAHELRTPLTAMRTAIDVTLSKRDRTPEQLEAMAERIRRSVDRAEETVEALLTLSASEAGRTVSEPVDLAAAAEDALDAVRTRIRERRLEVVTELDAAPTRGDRVLIERMAANLVQNAVRHNHQAGWLRVRTATQNGGVLLEVANTGPTLTEDQIPALFEPFGRAAQRLDPTEGVGLGLSIARAIVAAHGGTIEAHPRLQGGLEVSVSLRAEAPAVDGIGGGSAT